MASVNGTMAAVAEHSLVKVATPFVVAAILGVTGWLFTSVMSLEQKVKLMTAKFDTLNCKNTELLQMIENFSIEFLKTREYEF